MEACKTKLPLLLRFSPASQLPPHVCGGRNHCCVLSTFHQHLFLHGLKRIHLLPFRFGSAVHQRMRRLGEIPIISAFMKN
jgi:hypothetical protein